VSNEGDIILNYGSIRRWTSSKLATLALLGILLFCCSNRENAQVTGGLLLGTVADSSGASVKEGMIVVTNTGTGVKRTDVTNAAGSYSIPNLLPGTYVVAASAAGFGPQEKMGILVEVGSQQIVDFLLTVSGRQEQVRVTSQADALQRATSDMTEYTDGLTIRELPLNARSWTDLALLQPGVTAIETQPSFETGADRGTRGFGSQVTISGARPQQNNYRLNGVSLNDYANGAGSVLGGNLGADAIAEFSVTTSNAPAEYGKTAGGVINAITKSGTNGFHGDAYEFLRNSALDARNFFDGSSTPSFKRNQFGGALGGPVRKDQTFFFVNYESLRQSKGVTSVSTVPSQDARNGVLHNADGSVTNLHVDPSAEKYLTFWPLPNAGATPTGLGNIGFYDFVGQQIATENFGIARIDHRFSDRDQMFGSYLYDRMPYTYPDSLNSLLFVSTTARQIVAIEESHTFTPTIVNSLRVGVNRDATDNNIPSQAINPATADPSLAAIPGEHAAAVSISGLTAFTGGFGASGVTYRWTSYQINDDLFWNRGQHSIKVGVAVERMQLNEFSLSSPNGQFSFASLSDFLSNQPTRFNAALPTAISPRALRETLAGGYVQDDWRVQPNLTVNLGLRYEMSTVPTETQGKLSNLINLTDATPHLGNPFFHNPTLANVEPRVGFAWDPVKRSRTVVRSAFGIYDVLPLPYEFVLPATVATPYTVLGSVSGAKFLANTFFTGATPLLGPSSLRATYIENNPKRNYVMQWNFTIQHEITNHLSVVVAYVGSRGVHQPFYSSEYDIVLPTKTAEGYLFPSPVSSGTLLNPNFGSIRGMTWSGSSTYHALQLGVRKTMSHGIQLQASYSWSKSIDDSSSSLAQDAFGNSASTYPFDLKLGRGLSDFNVGRLLVLNGMWQVPGVKSHQALLNWMTEGWQLGGILRASDGLPFTPTFGSDGDPLGGSLQDFPNRLVGSGCSSLVNTGNPNNYIKTQCFAVPTASAALYPQCDASYGVAPQCFNLMGNAGRNILIGPGLVNLDLSVFKNIRIPIGENRIKMQFRAELFNILNHANFAIPSNTDIFDSTGKPTGVAGLITSTATDSREIQFGVKILW
jgi:hypothetical protein